MDGLRLFFESTGRMRRLPFLFAIAVVVAVFAAYERLVTGWPHALTGWAVHLVLVFAAASVLAKRLHDRGHSGWWAAPVLLAFDLTWPRPQGVVGMFAVLVLAIAATELALLKGEPRWNGFGAPPA